MPVIGTEPVSPILGVEITGVDLRDPIDDTLAAMLQSLLDKHHLILFRDQTIDPDQQLRLAEVFGSISRQGAAARKGHGNVSFISNVHPEGRAGDSELRFHSDQAAFENPQRVLMLYGLEVPSSGGKTLYSSAARGYRDLPDALKERIASLHLNHVQDYGAYFAGKAHTDARRRLEDIPADELQMHEHPIVLRHPRTGEPLLYVNEQHAYRIAELDETESNELLAELRAHLRRPENIYTHTWRVGDLIAWDNLALLHARTTWPKGERRTLRRIQLQ